MPDASNFDAFVPVVVEDVNHCFGLDDVDLPRTTRDKFTIGSEVAGIDFRDFDVFFENFHSGFYRRIINGIARTIKAMKKPAT